jgi:hypothetical protein
VGCGCADNFGWEIDAQLVAQAIDNISKFLRDSFVACTVDYMYVHFINFWCSIGGVNCNIVSK